MASFAEEATTERVAFCTQFSSNVHKTKLQKIKMEVKEGLTKQHRQSIGIMGEFFLVNNNKYHIFITLIYYYIIIITLLRFKSLCPSKRLPR